MQVTIIRANGDAENAIVVDWDRSKYIGCVLEDGTYMSIRRYRTSFKITNKSYKLPHYFPYHPSLSNKSSASEIKQCRKKNKQYYTVATNTVYIKANSLKKAFSIMRGLGKERYTLTFHSHTSSESITSPIFQTVPYQYYGIFDCNISERTILREINKLRIDL